ncbi:MAG: DUF3553 domain-containing protein [bacterium]|nr:DUF3553 domain-containing protein [bacterium]
MIAQDVFGFGDRVVHAGKPEWGIGVVSSAQNLSQDGKACQRLTIRFERAGLKTLSTAVADIRPADQADAPARQIRSESEGATTTESNGSWLQELEAGDPAEVMARLPQSCTDPFQSIGNRIKATLGLFRFSDSGGSLLDWAAAQTGMKDPLSRFNRHELEQFFARFQTNRDAHLRRLAAEALKKDPGCLREAAKNAPPKGVDMLRGCLVKR